MESINSYAEDFWAYIWGAFTAGLAEYRAGNYQKAEFWCQKSLSRIPENNIELLAMNNIVLALSYSQMKKTAMSENYYKKAKLHHENLNRLDAVNGFHNVLLVGLLLKQNEHISYTHLTMHTSYKV